MYTLSPEDQDEIYMKLYNVSPDMTSALGGYTASFWPHIVMFYALEIRHYVIGLVRFSVDYI